MRSIIKNIGRLQKLKDKKAKLKSQLDEVKDKITNIEDSVISTMINNGIQNLKLAGVGTIYLTRKDTVNIIDIPTFFNYLREKGEGDMIKEQVNYQTLNSWWNKLEEDIRPSADEIGLNSSVSTTVALRKN